MSCTCTTGRHGVPSLMMRMRPEWGLLGERVVAPGGAVHATGRCVQEPANTGISGQQRKLDGGPVIDLVGPLGVQVAEWVVAEGSQMDHGVQPSEAADFEVADVLPDGRNDVPVLAERAVLEEEGVEADHLVSRSQQLRDHDRSNVTVVPCYENAHASSSLLVTTVRGTGTE